MKTRNLGLAQFISITLFYRFITVLFVRHEFFVFKAEALMAVTSTAEGSSTTVLRSHNVLVTGASGRTGKLVFETLLEDPRFEPKALVRSARSAKKLMKQVPKTRLDQIVVSDVTTWVGDTQHDKTDIGINENTLPPGLINMDSMVVCTSAVPTISKFSLFKALIMAPFNLIRGKKAVDFRKFRFVWKYGHYPEKVDYHGQVAQFEMAKKLKIKEIILVGSMGGTDPSNFLNQVGKDQKGGGHGDILLWKRKAENYLIDSGLDYVIIHPGGLTDTPPGQEDYVLDVNDKLVNNSKRSISRGDVAKLCVAALSLNPSELKCTNCVRSSDNKTKSINASVGDNNVNNIAQGFRSRTLDSNLLQRKQIALDCVTQAPENGKKVRSAEQALKDFLEEGKIYDYAL